MLRRALFVAVLAMPAATLAAEPAGFIDGTKAAFELRYRYETVDQDGLAKQAEANTLRGRMTLTSGVAAGFSVVMEIDGLASVLPDSYNSTRNGKTQYPVVADPADFDLNQLYVQYAGLPATVVKLGRERIRLDNERFIGAVGWRQNEQTYDAFSIENKSLSKTTLTYAYVDEVRRVFGPDAGTPAATFEGGSHVFNAKYSGLPIGNITVYDYYLGFDNQPQLASNTYGLRFDGNRKLNDKTTVTYALEYALQSDAGDNLADIDAHYSLLEAGIKFGAFGFTAGQEVLSGETGTFAANRNPAFQTPLATLHKFQGWADKFLTTPSAGIDDRYIGATAALGGFNLQAAWHDYSAQAISRDYGTEWDLSASRKFAKRYDVLLKYADYGADELFTDTAKFWFQVTATF
jgi:hypothetical protein